jgi:nitrite reductase (NO-forming)
VVLSLVVLGVSLRATVTAGVQRRFDASLHAYLLALAAGLGGCALGIAMGVDAGGSMYARLRSAHLTLNLLGLVGIVVVGTLPLFTATQARVKASPRATPRAQARLLVWFGAALALAVVGFLADWHGVAAVGLAGYAVARVARGGLLPTVGRKQLRGAGPRLLQLGAGMAWWAGATLVAAWHAGSGTTVFTRAVLGALVVGGFAQILAAAVAYLGPVLRGGGHERLSAAFRTTRAWPGLVLANAAAVALVLGAPTVAGVAIALWVADAAARTAVLVRPAPHHV